MILEIRKGQKIPLNEDRLIITFERNVTALEIDTSAFLLGAEGKASSDNDFIFYGHPTHRPSASVVYSESDGAIQIFLGEVPRNVERIAVTATIYDADKRKQNFGQLKGACLKVKTFTGVEVATFKLDTFTIETAIVLCEIYRYKGTWKLNATGAGFKGGLAALCKNFGIEVSDEITAPPVEPPPVKKVNTARKKSEPPIKITSSANEPPPSRIELKKGQKVNIKKRGNQFGEITINLNWSQPSAPKGFFDNIFGSKAIDLDLACLYEMQNGDIGAIQALGNLFGSLNYPPYIELDGDDRTGSVAAGETIRVNGKRVNEIKRILIYTFIYSGAADWAEARGVVTVRCLDNPELIVRMDDYGSKLRTCAIALLENVGGTLSVEKVVNFFRDSKEMDDAFNWGLQWTVGRKD